MFFKKKEESNVDILKEIKERLTDNGDEKQSSVSDENFLNDILTKGDFSSNKKPEGSVSAIANAQKLIDDINKAAGGYNSGINDAINAEEIDELLNDDGDEDADEDVDVDLVDESKDKKNKIDLDDDLDDILNDDFGIESDDDDNDNEEEDELLGVANKQKNSIEGQKTFDVNNNRDDVVGDVAVEKEKKIVESDKDLSVKDDIGLNIDYNNDNHNDADNNNENNKNDANFGEKDLALNDKINRAANPVVKSATNIINNVGDDPILGDDNDYIESKTEAFNGNDNKTNVINVESGHNKAAAEAHVDIADDVINSKSFLNETNFAQTNSLSSNESRPVDVEIKNNILPNNAQQKSTLSTIGAMNGEISGNKSNINNPFVADMGIEKKTINISDKTKDAVKVSITELIEKVKNQVSSKQKQEPMLSVGHFSDEQVAGQFCTRFILPQIVNSLMPKVTEYLDAEVTEYLDVEITKYLDANLEKIIKDVVDEKINEIIDDYN